MICSPLFNTCFPPFRQNKNLERSKLKAILKLVVVLFFLYSNLALTQTLKKSEDEFINLTNDMNKNGQKALNNEVQDQAFGKKSLS